MPWVRFPAHPQTHISVLLGVALWQAYTRGTKYFLWSLQGLVNAWWGEVWGLRMQKPYPAGRVRVGDRGKIPSLYVDH